MKPEEIRRHLLRRPFSPFEITILDGERYVIGHPENLVVRETYVFVAEDTDWAIFHPDSVVSIRSARNARGRVRR
ncbi:MAG: hypothetical protein HY720_32570 [Planctomycetes bacterium]|nr:hypothetical protein [Planctomycetota bacterium]